VLGSGAGEGAPGSVRWRVLQGDTIGSTIVVEVFLSWGLFLVSAAKSLEETQ
jgi:hypothetical protein